MTDMFDRVTDESLRLIDERAWADDALVTKAKTRSCVTSPRLQEVKPCLIKVSNSGIGHGEEMF